MNTQHVHVHVWVGLGHVLVGLGDVFLALPIGRCGWPVFVFA